MWESCLLDIRERAERFAKREKLTFRKRLGCGVHGIVLLADRQGRPGRSAVKIHERRCFYERERDVYLRLRARGVVEMQGFNVPELISHDDEFWVIEMSVVTRPFVLDFAGAYLDTAPDYTEDVLAMWREDKAEQFGPQWSEVQTLLAAFRRFGIHIADVNRGNIAFRDAEDELEE